MSGINLTGDKRVKEAFAKLDQAVQRGIIAKTAQAVHDYVEHQADTHTKDGALHRSVYLKSIPNGWEVGHDERIAPYTKFVHWGTKPHIIKPKDKKALRWVSGGKFAFAKAVHHPGYIGHPWLKDAKDKVLPQKFNQFLQEAINAL
jgi:hypothetical protein